MTTMKYLELKIEWEKESADQTIESAISEIKTVLERLESDKYHTPAKGSLLEGLSKQLIKYACDFRTSTSYAEGIDHALKTLEKNERDGE